VTVRVFDIETTNLNADFGVVLCACVFEPETERLRTFSQRALSPIWPQSAMSDREVIARLFGSLGQADFLIAHNGSQFDLPFLRARARRWGIPWEREIPLLDPCLLARRRFKLSGNSLSVLSQFFQTRKKTPLVPEDWLKAALARDHKAMRRIEKHCQADVLALASLVPFFRGLWGQRVCDGVMF
jgi:uncharacterized protein YprB with RNaseH-like and TPR domain